jgi:site-specific DNA-adenine methylase
LQKKDRNEALERLQSLQSLESLESLERLEKSGSVVFSSKSYNEIDIPDNVIIYCDPPYK